MTAACYPQGWTNTSTAFYSPGICPSGYTTACITANTAGTVTETIATCCPRSFDCAATNDFLGCHSSISGGQAQLITVVAGDFSSIATTETEIIGGYLNAYGVQIRFQATDLVPITTTISRATPSSSPGATPTPPVSTPTSTPAPSSGLSTGAEAGIGVGAAIAICIGLVLLWLGWRQRVKRRRAPSVHLEEPQATKAATKHPGFFEVQGNGLSEAPGDDLQREVAGHHMVHRHELDGRGS
ncbi:MAG: hypothetical protein MMC33_006982 [Icmadophila ericetorum]|nr:hypothetical protein [Icmadophila ericetorum]